MEAFVRDQRLWFTAWMTFVAASFAAALLFNQWMLYLLPLLVMFVYYVFIHYKSLLYLFFIAVPFSIEYNLTPSLGTDLPSEPLMWLMFGISLLLFASRLSMADFRKYRHPITLLLLVHLAWIFMTTLNSSAFLLSFKMFLAKLWYIIPFYFFTLHVINHTNDLKKLFRIGIVFLSVSVMIVLFRHYKLEFAFDKVNEAVSPLFRNHVNYACIVILFLPYLWALLVLEKNKKVKALLLAIMAVFVAGIYFSYTRAAIISLMLCYPIYLVVKARLIKPALAILSVVTVLGIAFLLYDNNYLLFTPDYNKTITHTEFDNLVSATTKGEDISTMERVYRWVAGIEMIKTKPIFGFGPSTFYSFYKGYTVSSFQTYVSDNPDHSTVHNYFLLTFIEQGVIGFIIFMTLCFIVLIKGEKVYHQTKSREDRAMILAAMMSFMVILLINLINDMIETDKVGPFFFLSMAIIVFYENKWRWHSVGERKD